MSLSRDAFAQWSDTHRARVDALLVSRFADAWPPRFREACVYPLQTGGKRMRPLLGLAAAQALGQADHPGALPAASAVELIHAYSLVHDDLPAMDDDDVRRGKPTVHKVYDDATGILVGDALLTEAFSLLADAEVSAETQARLVMELAQAAGHRGMVGGQAADVGLGGPVSDLETLLRLHRGKTGALIRCAVRLGAIVGGATPDQLADLTRYGEAVGLAFQLADDILDEEQDAGEDGPPSVVKLLGVDETRARAHALIEEARCRIQGLSDPSALDALATYTVERKI